MNKLFIFFAVFLSINFTNVAIAAPNSDAIEFWITHAPNSKKSVPHTVWQELLDTYLNAKTDDGVNRFDYAGVSKTDVKKLDTYLDALQSIDPRTLNRKEQLPYWINFYNALTVKVILDEFPVESIREIRFLTSPFGPWDKNLVEVMGEDLSLNDIEHGILRPIWQDPRIHFSVNCASIGCPNLAAQAFTADNAEALMESSAVDFINHGRGVKVTENEIVLSSIFDWYSGDFGKNEAQVLSYLSHYYVGENKLSLTSSPVDVQYQYDWALNKDK